MSLIVQKYGGTSVGTVERIQAVARRVVASRDEGANRVVAVVSAMSGETDRLIGLANAISDKPNKREYDVLVSTGEQVTIALLSMAIQELGVEAISLTGAQAKIVTDPMHTEAKIRSIHPQRVFEQLDAGKVVVLPGFQGVVEGSDQVATLGRGGSDLSAVAIAAALKADACEVYTDVDGVYTTDPRISDRAKKIDRISYEEMLEMASLGAKVMQTRAVGFAMRYDVPIHVRSSFNDNEGTWIIKEDESMESLAVSAVAYNKNEAKVIMSGVPDKPGVAAQLFDNIAQAGINVDMIIQNVSREGKANLTFTVPTADYSRTMDTIRKEAEKIGIQDVSGNKEIVKVSIIGVGMRSHTGVASMMFKTLADNGINIQMISTSEIKISCVIEEKYTELAVRALHSTFGLDSDQVEEEDDG